MTMRHEPPCPMCGSPMGWEPDEELFTCLGPAAHRFLVEGWGAERVLVLAGSTGDPGAEPLSRWSCPEEGH